MDARDLINEMDRDDFNDLRHEEDADAKKKPFRLVVSQLHCYKVVDEPVKVIYAKTDPQHLHEVKRMVRDGKRLSGIKKIFRGTQFITLNIMVNEKASVTAEDL